MKVDYRSDWTIGTALDIDEDGYFYAETYDRLADSPVLIGNLTVAEIKINNINVGVYVYASDTVFTAKKILSLAEDVLKSASTFIGYSPVPYYKFLFCILDNETYQRNGLIGSGALEHSYSSIYVHLVNEGDLASIKNIMAHEFMHILTPLHLHSEIIHTYNFAQPIPSEHCWLYEGVTEWASYIMQLRSGLLSTEDLLKEFSRKLLINERFDNDISLSEMSLGSYKPAVNSQFINFYHRGAITAALLDIRLLELSQGKKGLREVYLQLLHDYGKYKPFPEENFFNLFVEMTYPEIQQFIDKYIRGSEPLPVVEYIEKLGFKYIAEKPSSDSLPSLGTAITLNNEGELMTLNITENARKYGLNNGDILLKAFGQEVSLENIRDILGKTYTMKVGDPVDLLVKRGDETIELTIHLSLKVDYHVFEDLNTITKEQKFLREQWMQNLEFPE